MLPSILRQYADIEIDNKVSEEETQNQPNNSDVIVPSETDLTTPQTPDHNAIINNVMSQVQPK